MHIKLYYFNRTEVHASFIIRLILRLSHILYLLPLHIWPFVKTQACACRKTNKQELKMMFVYEYKFLNICIFLSILL